MNYNFIEIKLSRFLNHFPFFKKVTKRIYQYLTFYFFKKKYNYYSDYELHALSYNGCESFFGYYDKSPESPNGVYLAFHSVNESTKIHPKKLNSIDIIILKYGDFIHKLETRAFNWQIGSRLQWLNNTKILYNDYSERTDSYISKIFDIENFEIYEYDIPIFDANEDFGISVDFTILDRIKSDYGFYKVKNKTVDNNIYLLNFNNNNKLILFNINDILKIEYKNEFKFSTHTINHIMLSPKSTSFIYIHRYYYKNKKHDRLLLYDIQNKKHKLLVDSGLISHMNWISENELIGYYKSQNSKIGYHILNLQTLESKPLFNNQFYDLYDGHPSFKNNKIVFDTYPDKSRLSSLYIYNIITSKINNIGLFYQPLCFNGIVRCDLHPKWNYLGNKIFFESTHTKKRQIYFIYLKI